jgi:hypothetical protein
MSYELTDRVIRTAWPVSALAKWILAVLANYANAKGWAWPSLPQLARQTQLTRTGVWKLTMALEQSGALGIVRQPGRVNRYHVHVDPCTTCLRPPQQPVYQVDGLAPVHDVDPPVHTVDGTRQRGGPEAVKKQSRSCQGTPADAPAAHRRQAAHRVAKKSPRTDPPDPRIAVLLQLFCETHEATLGTKYLCAGARDAVAFKRALTTYPEATIRATLAAFFRDRTSRLSYGAKVTQFVDRIGTLAATPDVASTTERGRTVGNVEAMKRWLERSR